MRKGKGEDRGGIYLLVFKTKLTTLYLQTHWRTCQGHSLGLGKRERRRPFSSKRKAGLGLRSSLFSLAQNDRAVWLPRSGGMPPGGARRPRPPPARSRTSTSALERSCRN